jgi:hypothetical protein
MNGLARLALIAALAMTSSCGESERALDRAGMPMAPKIAMAQRSPPPDAGPVEAKSLSTRYVAVRNFVVIEVDAATVEATLKQAQERCAAPDCEVLEAAISRDFRGAPPNARIRLRIAPKASQGFIDELARAGDVIERRTESEDKTEQVVDVEARLRNMTELRDRLRKLLAAPGASVKDLVEVESQLARVQSDLDSAAGIRKALANETDKVMVSIEIRARRAIAETGVFAPVGEAVTSIGHTFAQSLAGLIAFLVAIIPWLVLLVAAAWAWRRWRRARRNHP